jgi:type II secretory pathway component PulF
MDRCASGLNAPPAVDPAALDHLLHTLGDLLDAGLDLYRALCLLVELLPQKRLQSACLEQADSVRQGKDWDQAMSDCQWLRWPKDTVAWICAGLRTGLLRECLQLHGQERLTRSLFYKTLLQRLAYPTGVLMLSVVLCWFMSSQLPADADNALTVIALFSVLAMLCLAGLAFYLYALHRRSGINETADWSRCLHALALTARCGLSLPQALDLLLDDISPLWLKNPKIGQALSDCRQAIAQGQGLLVAVSDAGFPPSTWHCLQLAQISGNLPKAWQQAACLLAIRVKAGRNNLLKVLPPYGLILASLNLTAQYGLFIWPLYRDIGQ